MAGTTNKKTGTPLLPRSRVLITVTQPFEAQMRCAREYGVGVEVQTFAYPAQLMSNDSVYEKARRMAKRVARLKGPIGCHGAFIDTIHHSTDAEVTKVARMRYLQAFDIAEILRASYLVFHSQYNPLIRIAEYPALYHKQSLRFWPRIIEEAERRGILIYLENMFEDSPRPLRRLADALDSPHVKLCLDIAHVTLYSQLHLSEWIDTFGEHMAHVHLNDTGGVQDDHVPLGKGVVDLPRTIALFKQTRRPLTYAIETNNGARTSLRYLGFRSVKSGS